MFITNHYTVEAPYSQTYCASLWHSRLLCLNMKQTIKHHKKFEESPQQERQTLD